MIKWAAKDVRTKRKKGRKRYLSLSLLCCDPNCLEWLRCPTICCSSDKDSERAKEREEGERETIFFDNEEIMNGSMVKEKEEGGDA